jgi:hypothetical protein
MGEKGSRISVRRPLFFAGASVIGCLLVFLLRGLYVYWDNLLLVNFLASWIPFVLSVLLAFVPSGKELRPVTRTTWRALVVAVGFSWSGLLWHQQALTAASALSDQQTLLNGANKHTDEQIGHVQVDIGNVQSQVEQDLQNTREALSSEVRDSANSLGSSIGKVIIPKSPEPAKLVFNLYKENAPDKDFPIISETLSPNKDGNYLVEFGIKNVTDVAAETVDLWIYVSNDCQFAAEPEGFQKVPGLEEHGRHANIASINPGANWGKATVLVKAPEQTHSFQFGIRYSCKSCGKMLPVQTATIFMQP